MCLGGGLGFFFEVEAGRRINGGTLLGVYFGEDTEPPCPLTIKEAIQAWKENDYVLGGVATGYVVKGHEECGPARANDGFSKVNANLVYNPAERRMELQTQGPFTAPSNRSAVFEVLVNYDTPYAHPSYWDKRRRDLLPATARKECLAYYDGGHRRKNLQKEERPAPVKTPATITTFFQPRIKTEPGETLAPGPRPRQRDGKAGRSQCGPKARSGGQRQVPAPPRDQEPMRRRPTSPDGRRNKRRKDNETEGVVSQRNEGEDQAAPRGHMENETEVRTRETGVSLLNQGHTPMGIG